MKDLEDTPCEVLKTVELQVSNWDRINSSLNDDARPLADSPASTESSNFLGGFLEDTNYAWLSYGPKLVVVNVKTGVNICSWIFKERVSCVTAFPAQSGQIPLLLVGLDNDASRIKDSYGLVCIFDCTISQVLRAIRMPAGVEQLCVINGGAEWEECNDKRVDNLMEHQGMACVALRNLDHFMVDLRRNSWENPMNLPIADESNPAEIDIAETNNQSTRYRTNREKHAVHNLINERLERYIGFDRDEFESSILYQDTLTTAIVCSRKIGCLISGCLGRVIIWQNDGVVRWISPTIDDNLSVSHLTLLEPTDDPRPFCYLWVAYQDENSLTSPILRMYAMLFERKYSDKGTNLYFNLEGEPSLKFELELEAKSRIRNLYPIGRECNPEQTESGNRRGEDSLLLISMEGKTILFDLNQWYKEQMPRFIGDCQNVEAIFASYCTQPQIPCANRPISSAYLPSTLREFPSTLSTTPEEFFFPNSLSLEWIELGSVRITFWRTRGVQAQLLREMAMAGPIIMLQPTETYHRCITVGLVPFNADNSLINDADNQRDALLSLCLEQRWTTFLLKCAKAWSDGSAAYLFPVFIRWAIQRASTIRLTAHSLCIPLFDQSGSSIGEAEIRTLRFFSQQMECLCNVVENLPIETNELQQQQRALRRISTYLQILLWFYDVGLLPETDDIDEEALPISFILKIPYPAERLALIYAEKRERYRRMAGKKEENEEDLFIDELITRECPSLRSQWEHESGDTNYGGNYPPPSLQSLLRSCLTDCYSPDSNEMENKHQIIIYLLMDLVMMLQGSCPGVDQLIKYPSAFKLSPSLIKLTHALWFLDNEDYQGFLDTMTGQLVSESDIKDWHHRLVMRTLLRSSQNKIALVYLRVRKPPLASIHDQCTAISLSVEHGLVQSAFHRRPPSHYSQLLTRFFRACKAHGKLNDILHLALNSEEEEAFVHFLEGEKCDETRLLYYLQRCRYNEASNVFPTDPNMSLQKAHCATSLSMFHAYNATLPEITRRFSSSQVRRHFDIEPESSFPRPMSHFRSRVRSREILETVIRKARETFQRADRSQIPFISAPCLSLQTSQVNLNSDCALFVEQARRTQRKRSHDMMRDDDDDDSVDQQVDVKKRRKTVTDSDKVDASTREAAVSMVIETPLVKRKYQMTSDKDQHMETPHSILKIRQMIRDSSSPSEKVSVEDEKVFEREKKPRQIRFSIVKPLVQQQPIAEENESEKSKSRSVTPKPDASETEDNQYYSPNASTVSLYEDTVLTDESVNTSLCDPRARPSLKRSNFAISPFDPSKKFSKRNSDSSTTGPLESGGTSADVSFSSQIVSSTFMDVGTPRMNNHRTSLPSSSIYADTILSPGSSIEVTLAGSPAKNIYNLPRTSTKLDDLKVPQNELREENHSEHTRTSISQLSYSRTIHTKAVIEEVDIQDDESHSDIMDVEQVPVLIEEHSSMEIVVKMNEEIDEDVEAQIIIEQRESDLADDIDEEQQENSSAVCLELDEAEIVVENESQRISEDIDDELLALRYEEEEDDDDVFESLTNSVEQNHTHETLPKSVVQDASRKSAAGLFIEEFNITDDESSTSIVASQSTTEQLNSQETVVNDNELEASKIANFEDANITDDEIDHDRAAAVDEIQPDTSIINEPITVEKSSKQTPRTSMSAMIVNEDIGDSTPVRMTRSRRASSVQPTSESPALESQEAQISRRSRRASSLVHDIASPTRTLRTTSSESDSSDQTPPLPKRGRGRRSASLIKEVLTTSIQHDLGDINEFSMRRNTRRAASVQKEVPAVPITPNESTKSRENPIPMDEDTSGEPAPEIVKKVRGKRATSVNKDVEIKPRKTRATSVTSDIDTSTKDTKPKRTRAASVSKESISEVVATESVPARRTRAVSVSKETIESPLETNVSTRRKRGGSVSKESVEIVPTRRTRATSISKEAEEVSSRKRRGASLTKESVEEKSTTTTTVPRRSTRASSQSKEIVDVAENSSKRITRRKASLAKENSIEYLKTRKGSILTEVIPEEVDDETIFDVKPRENIDVPLVRRTRGTSVSVIPEEDTDSVSESTVKQEKVARKTRAKRATSVDLSQSDVKRRTRGLARSTTVHDSGDDDDEEQNADESEMKSTRNTSTITTRRKRAMSETKELQEGSQKIVDRPKRGAKLSQKNSTTDDASFQFSVPDEPRGAPMDSMGTNEDRSFVFSPPVLRPSTAAESKPRSSVSNFISPISDEERKMGKYFPKKSSAASQTRRKLPFPVTIRQSFTIPPRSNNTDTK